MRTVLAFVASLVACGYLAAVSHMAFVAHAICAEHGEIIHVAHHGAPSRGPSRVPLAGSAYAVHAGEARTSGESAHDGGAPSPHEHDHCPLGTSQPGEARVAAATYAVLPEVVASPVDPSPPPGHVVARASPPPPIAILLLSPKSSPPV